MAIHIYIYICIHTHIYICIYTGRRWYSTRSSPRVSFLADERNIWVTVWRRQVAIKVIEVDEEDTSGFADEARAQGVSQTFSVRRLPCGASESHAFWEKVFLGFRSGGEVDSLARMRIRWMGGEPQRSDPRPSAVPPSIAAFAALRHAKRRFLPVSVMRRVRPHLSVTERFCEDHPYGLVAGGGHRTGGGWLIHLQLDQ